MSRDKNRKTIALFIPHIGCPNACIFCNQHRIAGREGRVSLRGLRLDIEQALTTIRQEQRAEIAFFGGSFTALDPDFRQGCLELAREFIRREERIDSIRLSTRPDAIDGEILRQLKDFGVRRIELGVQSLDEEVLRESRRGHDAACVFASAAQIRSEGFSLGLQMMVGLPLDTEEKAIRTAQAIAEMKPDFVRIYPVLVVSETELAERFRRGEYEPLSLDEAVSLAAKLYLIFVSKDIKVARIGLQASEGVQLGRDVLAGPFHPAMGELAISALYRDFIETYMITNDIKGKAEVLCPRREISKVIGNNKSNLRYFERKYGFLPKIREKETAGADLIINGEEIGKEQFLEVLNRRYFA